MAYPINNVDERTVHPPAQTDMCSETGTAQTISGSVGDRLYRKREQLRQQLHRVDQAIEFMRKDSVSEVLEVLRVSGIEV